MAGAALLDIYLYYLAGQLRHLQKWIAQEQGEGVERYLLKIVGVDELLVRL